MAREEGFYWLKLKDKIDPVVAEWSTLIEGWYIPGVDFSFKEEECEVLSQRLIPPS